MTYAMPYFNFENSFLSRISYEGYHKRTPPSHLFSTARYLSLVYFFDKIFEPLVHRLLALSEWQQGYKGALICFYIKRMPNEK